MEASIVQSLRQESSVQESDSLIQSGSLTAANSEEPKDEIVSEEEGASTMESFQMTGLNWMNVLLLGGGFFLLFTAFQTTAFVQVNTFIVRFFVGYIKGRWLGMMLCSFASPTPQFKLSSFHPICLSSPVNG